MYFSIVLVIVFIACFASLMNAGLWSNTINFIIAVTSGLIAMNYFEALAGFLDKQVASLTYLWDFVSLWVIFALSFTLLRVITDQLSKVKVRFFMPVEKAGGIIMCLLTCWIVVCFAATAFHTAPLSRNFLGFQETPESRNLFGVGPDKLWLAWVHRQSLGTFSRIGALNVFDPKGDFVLRYAARRSAFEKEPGLKKTGK